VKAPLGQVLDFAAYHLDLGAHRIHVCLDEPDPRIRAALLSHPALRVHDCDPAHWRRLGIRRPRKHQVRQSANATHVYGLADDLDWLAHIDVDEFLWPVDGADIARILGSLDSGTLCARLRPVEALAGLGNAFKAMPATAGRAQVLRSLYPRYGQEVRAGFLSHVAGKLIARTGLSEVEFRIHNFRRAGVMNPGGIEFDAVELCHRHVTDWPEWIAAYRYRLEKGAYRAELAPTRPREQGGRTLHELLQEIEAQGGEAGLRGFFDEICADTPRLRHALDKAGLLRIRDLGLADKRRRHFPDFA